MAGYREMILKQSELDRVRFEELPSPIREALQIELAYIARRVMSQHGTWHAIDVAASMTLNKAAA